MMGSTMDRMRRSAVGAALVLALVAAPSASWSESGDGLSNEAGIGALAALSTLIYGPVKLTYATLGLLFGGMSWGLSGGDPQVLDSVITAAVRGDYVVTPEHIRMERTLEFYGQKPQYREVQHAAAAPAAAVFVEEDYSDPRSAGAPRGAPASVSRPGGRLSGTGHGEVLCSRTRWGRTPLRTSSSRSRPACCRCCRRACCR